jgi:hypothetical protein
LDRRTTLGCPVVKNRTFLSTQRMVRGRAMQRI